MQRETASRHNNAILLLHRAVRFSLLICSRPFTPGYTGFVPAANESVELRRYPRSAAPPETSTAGTHR